MPGNPRRGLMSESPATLASNRIPEIYAQKPEVEPWPEYPAKWHDYVASYFRGDHPECEVKPYLDPWYRFARVLAALRRVTEIPRGATWLDVGCQMGKIFRFLQMNGYEVHGLGVDDWPPQLKTDDTWQYCRRNLEKPFQLNGQFDFFTALETLEHMDDTDRFLEQCREHLKPRGYYMISTPNINSFRNRVTVPLGSYPAGLEYKTVIHHVRLYNLEKLKIHLAEHGFRVLSLTGVSFLPARFLPNAAARGVSERLAEAFPQLCGHLVAICQRLE
jgi:2-polyprenyl-3-methyl-5-hydroxy-6-metoxy-1,4-benzoquinol methylase